jgi:hypothetical protein
MARAEEPGVRVELGEDGRPPLKRVAVMALAGLILGLVWPALAGLRVAPPLPSGPRPEGESERAAPGKAPEAADVEDEPTEPALAGARAAATDEAPVTRKNKQTVVVGASRIVHCHDGKQKLDECGTVRADAALLSELEQLSGCPSALGLRGELEVGLDLAFDKRQITLVKAEKSELPQSTVSGIYACLADYVRDVDLDKIEHKHARYRLTYRLAFYPPGAEPAREPTRADGPGADERAPGDGGAEDAARGLGTVVWDTALVRSEPSTGKVVARLVRGTRVELLGRRKDWYRVKLRGRDGWVYRGAVGM